MKLPYRAKKIAALALAFILLASPTHAAEPLVGIASIIDADTIEIHGTRIRLFGIDAPKSRQLCKDAVGADYRCGQQAALALADHVGSRTLSCDPRDIDRYGRTVAVCYMGGKDLCAWLVLEGWAVAYRHYSKDYIDEEAAAEAAHRGIWAGIFQMRWDWRAADRYKSNSSQ
jgi:endonuclease YncB( thermonuclease family)